MKMHVCDNVRYRRMKATVQVSMQWCRQTDRLECRHRPAGSRHRHISADTRCLRAPWQLDIRPSTHPGVCHQEDHRSTPLYENTRGKHIHCV